MHADETNIREMDPSAGPDYTYVFEDLTDKARNSGVQVFKHHSRRSALRRYSMRVAVEDEQTRKRRLTRMPPVIADCLDVAAAAFVADKLTARFTRKRTHIHVVLPLRCPDFWNEEDLITELEKILYWFMRDTWTFEFVQRQADPRPSEMQPRLPMPAGEDLHDHEDHNSKLEVALWSGGLEFGMLACAKDASPPGTYFCSVRHGEQRQNAASSRGACDPSKRTLRSTS